MYNLLGLLECSGMVWGFLHVYLCYVHACVYTCLPGLGGSVHVQVCEYTSVCICMQRPGVNVLHHAPPYSVRQDLCLVLFQLSPYPNCPCDPHCLLRTEIKAGHHTHPAVKWVLILMWQAQSTAAPPQPGKCFLKKELSALFIENIYYKVSSSLTYLVSNEIFSTKEQLFQLACCYCYYYKYASLCCAYCQGKGETWKVSMLADQNIHSVH